MSCLNKYIIPRTSCEIKRLDLMHKIYLNFSANMLESAGLSKTSPPNLTVFDVACATGAMTSWITERTTGKVTGLDYDVELLDVAKKKLARHNAGTLSKVEFKQIDLNKLEPTSITMQADIVYSRFVLHHLLKPTVGISNIINMTKPGGLIVLGEPVLDGSWVFPHNNQFDESMQLLEELYKQKGRNINYGKRLYNDLSTFSNVKIIDIQYYSPLLITEEYKKHHSMIMQMFREQFIDTCKITPNKYNLLMEQMMKIVDDTNSIVNSIGVIFVKAKKM